MPNDITSHLWVAEPNKGVFLYYLILHDFAVMGVKDQFPRMERALAARLCIRKNCMSSGHEVYTLTREEACAILENSKTPPMFTEGSDGQPV